MDFSKFKTPDWLKVGGAVGFLIFGFMSWVKIDYGGEIGNVSDSGGSVFDFIFTGTIPWILIMGSAIMTVLLVTGKMKQSKTNWPMLMVIANGLAAVLLLIRFIFNPLDGKSELEALGVDVQRGIGMILSLLAGLVAAAGSIMSFTNGGGNLKDLTDVNKIKDGFGQG
jgi:hypothetical protein